MAAQRNRIPVYSSYRPNFDADRDRIGSGLSFELKTVSEKNLVIKEDTTEKQKTVSGHGFDFGAAFFDFLIALTSLYFVAFAILAYVQRDTVASTSMNEALFKMGSLNPTLFPIVFTTIMAKFIKALANWKIEQGTTVGTIQHLLGSRSLVASITNPLKLRFGGFIVPLLVLVWVLNPVGGQSSLRLVSKGFGFANMSSPINYLDVRQSPYTSGSDGATQAFTLALFSPSSSKNGTRDMLSNLQVPMLEPLKSAEEVPDEDGWYNTTRLGSFNGYTNSTANATSYFEPVYISIMGLPYLLSNSSTRTMDTGSGSDVSQDTTWDELSSVVPDVINVETFFSIETLYMYSDCHFNQTTADANDTIAWDNATVVTSTQGYSIDSGLNVNSTHRNETTARRIGFKSGLESNIVEAWCNLTTTYVELGVYCSTGDACSVQRIRESTLPHLNTTYTPFDGIAYNTSGNGTIDKVLANSTAKAFFTNMTQATDFMEVPKDAMSPIEYYLIDPAAPFQGTRNQGTNRVEVDSVGPALFSQRFSQLLNTFWLDNLAPFSMTGNFSASANDGNPSTTEGTIRVKQPVLKCHVTYMVLLIVISILLFAFGLATAYLDGTRRVPDVIDDFVNSLRYNPFVHVEQGPTMEGGTEKARRLHDTIVRMGDVKPDDRVGCVAIATPNERQRVAMLQTDRQYV